MLKKYIFKVFFYLVNRCMKIMLLDFPNCIFSPQTWRTELLFHRKKPKMWIHWQTTQNWMMLSMVRTGISALNFLVLIFSSAIDSKVIIPGLFFVTSTATIVWAQKFYSSQNIYQNKRAECSFLHYLWLMLLYVIPVTRKVFTWKWALESCASKWLCIIQSQSSHSLKILNLFELKP